MTKRRTNVKTAVSRPTIRCAIYTRKSSEEGLQQEFNSLDAQREAAPEIRFLSLKQVEEQLKALEANPVIHAMVATYIYAGLLVHDAEQVLTSLQKLVQQQVTGDRVGYEADGLAISPDQVYAYGHLAAFGERRRPAHVLCALWTGVACASETRSGTEVPGCTRHLQSTRLRAQSSKKIYAPQRSRTRMSVATTISTRSWPRDETQAAARLGTRIRTAQAGL